MKKILNLAEIGNVHILLTSYSHFAFIIKLKETKILTGGNCYE